MQYELLLLVLEQHDCANGLLERALKLLPILQQKGGVVGVQALQSEAASMATAVSTLH